MATTWLGRDCAHWCPEAMFLTTAVWLGSDAKSPRWRRWLISPSLGPFIKTAILFGCFQSLPPVQPLTTTKNGALSLRQMEFFLRIFFSPNLVWVTWDGENSPFTFAIYFRNGLKRGTTRRNRKGHRALVLPEGSSCYRESARVCCCSVRGCSGIRRSINHLASEPYGRASHIGQC